MLAMRRSRQGGALLVAWFWVLIAIVTDIFRESDSSGFAKAGSCLFVRVLPWLGVRAGDVTQIHWVPRESGSAPALQRRGCAS